MTPERMASLVARWVRLYTRDLPAPVAERRIEEIDADVQDHIAHERGRGTGNRRIALSILSRMIRGVAADAAWRGQAGARPSILFRPFVRVALVTGCLLLVPLVLMQVSDGTDWGVFDFVFAGLLLGGTGVLLELATRRPASLVYRTAAVAVGVAAIALGEVDDAPGLVLFGGLLIIGTVALTLRRAARSA